MSPHLPRNPQRQGRGCPVQPRWGHAGGRACTPASVWAPGAPSPHLSLQDAWSDQKGQLHLDPQQDYQLLRAQRTPAGLTLLFRRPFSTCDPRDYLIEVGGGRPRGRTRGWGTASGASRYREEAEKGHQGQLGEGHKAVWEPGSALGL